LLLREPLGIGTLLNVLIIGVTVDVVLALFDDPSAMWIRVLCLIAGPIVVGIAGGLYLGVDMGAGPRDGTMTALGRRGVRISVARFGVEAVAFVVGILLGGTVGAGTIWFLLAIGPATEFWLNRLKVSASPR
jgi:uncharacterized membrane protein YczE